MMETLGIALQSLKTNAMRSLLTMLGIVIGIASLISVVSLGQGGRAQIDSELSRFGINRFWIYSSNHAGGAPGAMLKMDDALFLRRKIKDATSVCPIAYRITQMSAGGRTANVEVVGTDEYYAQSVGVPLFGGRFLNTQDVDDARRVIVIGKKTAMELFGSASVGGEKVSLGHLQFTIVGIEDMPPLALSDNNTGMVYIPFTAFEQLYGTHALDEISLTASTTADVERVGKAAVEALEQRYNISNTLKSFNLAKEMLIAENILNTFSLVISAIAAVSLVVGGIGIMNIMLVSVKERRREIGLRKALGATDAQVLSHFLAESLLYALLGGILGVALGLGVTYAFAAAVEIPSGVTPGIVFVGTGFASLLGLFFGLYPAMKAAKLDPVVALREE